MKYSAFLLLCAVVALTDALGLHPNGCPKNWLIRKLIPHPVNCNQFYECWFGRRILRSCPPRFYFNIERNRCEWQLVAGCDRNNTVENDVPKPDENDGEDKNEGNYDPSKAPSICGAADSDGVLVAHEKCTKYYICVNGKPVAQRCPANLFFNPKNDECDWPRNVNCRDRDIPSSEEDQNDHIGAGNSNPNEAPYICAAVNSSGVLVAHKKCNQYYICDHGKPVAQRCPANLFFNPKKDECDWPTNVNCRDRDIPNSYPNEAPYICAAINSTSVLVAHENCRKYYICVNGRPVAQRCPANLFFNPKNDECDWPTNVNCRDKDIPRSEENQNDHIGAGNSNPNDASYICAAIDSTGVLVAHKKCNQYYICDHGKPVVQRCPANLFFNPKKDECDWPKNVNCRDKLSWV